MRINKILSLLILFGSLQACYVPVEPDRNQNEQASAVNVQLGIGYLQQNNLELANDKLDKALRQDPNSASAHNAYAILQDRLLQTEKAEYHYKKATTLDPKNSQAANNFGAFLCRHGRELESEKYFMQALKNPLYSTPEFAYTNAALCLLQFGEQRETEKAKEYLRKAIAAKNDFGPALLAMAQLLFDQGEYVAAKPYLDRFHLVDRPTARSLWLAIRNTLQIDGQGNVTELAQRLGDEFPDSEEFKAWRAIQ
ncbi:MAG: type IV pilus biogenesis/stability protein PilW [Gammaproteobacteria bacterium]